MSEVFTTDEIARVNVCGEVVKVDSPITIDALKKLAIKYSIKKYTVKNSNENLLSSDDFPYSGDVSIEAYNAPKSQ